MQVDLILKVQALLVGADLSCITFGELRGRPSHLSFSDYPGAVQ